MERYVSLEQVVVRLPNGSPAPGLQMRIEMRDQKCDQKSNDDGVAYCTFNIPEDVNSITIKVSNLFIGLQQT